MGAVSSRLEKRTREGESPVETAAGLSQSRLLLESRSLGVERKMPRYSSRNAEYDRKTDSKQVARAKDEKNSERRVKRK